jgi:ankyrin repeat protein
MVRLLVENGADPCIRNDSGETPLDVALKLRNCYAVLALLESKFMYMCTPTKN